jgi:hypothetical protein
MKAGMSKLRRNPNIHMEGLGETMKTSVIMSQLRFELRTP